MKIHVGCGKRFWPDWISVDGGDFEHVVNHDVALQNFPADQADVIYSSHMLEYFNRAEGFMLLENWHRVLKSGAELHLAVPDFRKISGLYNSNYYELEQFVGMLYGEMEMNGQKIYHKTCYDYKSLNRILAKVGFVEIRKVDKIVPNGEDDHSEARLPHFDPSGKRMSLNIICKKK